MTDSPTSPAAVEDARIGRAVDAMEVLCSDLADMCGREEDDDLTARIYRAAREAGVDHERDLEPRWLPEVRKAVAAIKVPSEHLSRVTAEAAIVSRVVDPDARRCLARADEFLAPARIEENDETRLRLAACLLDFAFDKAQRERLPSSSGLVPTRTEVETFDSRTRADLVQHDELLSHLMLGRTIRWGATVLAAIGIVLTGAVWLVPMVFVAWLASWMLIDKKALERVPEKRALESASEDGDGTQQIIEEDVNDPQAFPANFETTLAVQQAIEKHTDDPSPRLILGDSTSHVPTLMTVSTRSKAGRGPT